jgi:hypothetical protein
MTEDWQKLGSESVAKLLAEVNPRLAPVSFDPASTTIRSQKLPFYKEHVLLELTDLSTVPGARKYAIYKPGAKAGLGREAPADVNIINWTNQTIYDTNEKAPIVLNEDTVINYVKFFFSYVRGRHGRFLIIETIDDVRWQIEPPAQGRKVMQEMLSPVELEGKESDGTYDLTAFMVFKDSLFRTKIHVKPDGLVSMSEEDLKIEGMPILQDTAA